MWQSPPFLYPPLESPFVAALSAVSVVSGLSLGVSELRGENVPYSKFSRVVPSTGARVLPSRVGMLLTYAPALVAVLTSLGVPGTADGPRARLLAATLAAYFLKRVLEVLFVHRYSGSMPLITALTVSFGYLLNSTTMIYAQQLNHRLPDPGVDLLYPGVLLFAVGINGKSYKIPRGGMFELVACPHYLFEVIVFLGIAMIAQTVFAFAVAFSTAAYLVGRSCATRRWYAAKFDEFPAGIKALVPYVL